MLNKSQTNKLRMTASISFNEFENWAEDEVVPKSEFPMAQIIETLDGRICPLCRQRHGRLIDRTGEDWRRHGQQAHINCRVRFAYINKAERGPDGGPIAPDFTPPSKPLIDRHGHFIKEPKKFEPLRVPPFADGREFIVKRIIDPKTGERVTALFWNFQQRLIPGLDPKRTMHVDNKTKKLMVDHLKDTGSVGLARKVEKVAQEFPDIEDFEGFAHVADEAGDVMKSRFGLTAAKNTKQKAKPGDLFHGWSRFDDAPKTLATATWGGKININPLYGNDDVMKGLSNLWSRDKLMAHATETGITEAVASQMSLKELQKNLFISKSSNIKKQVLDALGTINHEQWHFICMSRGKVAYQSQVGKIWQEGLTEISNRITLREYCESITGLDLSDVADTEFIMTQLSYPGEVELINSVILETFKEYAPGGVWHKAGEAITWKGTNLVGLPIKKEARERVKNRMLELKALNHPDERHLKVVEWLQTDRGMTNREAKKTIRELFRSYGVKSWQVRVPKWARENAVGLKHWRDL